MVMMNWGVELDLSPRCGRFDFLRRNYDINIM